MIPIKHRLATHRFRGPLGSGMTPLYVESRVEDAEPVLVSYWQPTEEEIANILAGGVVALSILGGGQPPVRIGVVMP